MLPGNWVLVHADEIEIEPIGKERPRVVRKQNRTFTITPEKTREFEKRLAWLIAGGLNIRQTERLRFERKQPVGLSILAIHKRPKSMMRAAFADGLLYKPTAPDADNLAKAFCDALEKSGLIDNDAQIVWLEVGKAYAEKNGKPRICFELFALDEEQEQQP